MRRGPDVSSLLAFAASAAVLALSAAVVEPYLAAAGDAAVVDELDRADRAATGLTVSVVGRIPPEEAAAISDQLDAQLGGHVGPPTVTVQGDPIRLRAPTAVDDEVRVRPVARTGAVEALDLVAGVDGDGLLVPQVLASELGLRPGDTVEVARGERTATAEVSGVYRGLDPATAPAVVEDLAELAAPTPGREQRPMDLVFDPGDDPFARLAELDTTVATTWQLPAPEQLDRRADARALLQRLRTVGAAAEDPRSELGGRLHEVARGSATAEVGLAAIVRAADHTVGALEGPVRAVGLAGQAVALAVVAVAAGFVARRDTTVLRLAAVRGRSPLALGGAAVGRAAPGLVLGVVAGSALAVGGVTLLAPVAMPAEVVRGMVVAGAVSLVPAAVAVAGVTAVVAASTVRSGRRRRRSPARWPWELGVLALAGVALVQLRLGAGIDVDGGTATLSPLVLVFPILLLLGGVGLALRAGRRLLPRLRGLGGRRGPTGFLVSRRLAAATGPALLLTGAAALALGAVVYTAALGASLDASVEDKALAQVGAEVAATSGSLDADTVDGAAVHRARARLAPVEATVDVLLVEPTTFLEVAATAPLPSRTQLAGALERLDHTDASLPVLLVDGQDLRPTAIELPGARTPVEVVARPAGFPGHDSGRPMVVAVTSHVERLDDEVLAAHGWSRQVWAAGADAPARMVRAGLAEEQLVRADAVAGEPRLVSVAWALTALQGFGILSAALAVVGIAMFVAVRQRATQVAYALARRMGLRPNVHRAVVVLELLLLSLTALLVGTLLGVSAAAAVAAGVDPAPDLSPPPGPAVPVTAVVALMGVVGLGAVVGGAALHRGAERADVAEVLRSD